MPVYLSSSSIYKRNERDERTVGREGRGQSKRETSRRACQLLTAGAARISELEAAVEADNDVSTRSAVGANFVGTNLSSLSLLNIFFNHFHLDVNFLTFSKPNKLLKVLSIHYSMKDLMSHT